MILYSSTPIPKLRKVAIFSRHNLVCSIPWMSQFEGRHVTNLALIQRIERNQHEEVKIVGNYIFAEILIFQLKNKRIPQKVNYNFILQCMFQSWYLSVDTQLFFLAPIFIYPLWHWRRMGPLILGFGTVVSLIIPAVITYTRKFDPTILFYAK